MKKNLPIIICLVLLTFQLPSIAQTAFTNANNRLNAANFHSGVTVSVADFNNDGLDDIIKLDQGFDLFVEIQRTGNKYETRYLGSFFANSAWGMCVADLDKNGYLDVLAGGNSAGIQIFMTNNTGTSGSFINLANSGFFLQNATFADINNDGWTDAFLCDDNAASHIYLNDMSGNLNESTTTINFDVTSTDDSGNYGSVWTDFDNDGDLDLYIAKCRQGINDTTDGRRINVMFVNNGNGTFTENAAAYNLDVSWQSWTASFGDIDNDMDLDLLVTNHDWESQIFENVNGMYIDITSTTGFDITDITPIQSVMEDFDNDGYVDLLITGSNSRYYRNNGNKTFTKITGLFNANKMESFAIGDLNHDGFIDIYGSYATIYTNPTNIDDVIWMNNANTNHFVTLNLQGVLSNVDGIGARAMLYSNGTSQLREVRAGESYGTTNTSMLHFGLGQFTTIDSIVIRWPSGVLQTILSPSVDQFITVIEGTCVSPNVSITYPGNPVICTGQSLLLTATAGYNYLWNDLSTNPTLLVTAGGEYGVVVTDGANLCSTISKTIAVVENPNETPTIVTSDPLVFCNGSTITISAVENLSNYSWSNGDTTQSIQVNQTGTYTLDFQGLCQSFTSNAIDVEVLTVADPTPNDTTILGPAAVTLNANGNQINWYDDANATNLIGTGNSFTTPVLSQSTTYYLRDVQSFKNDTASAGLPAHSGTSLYSSNNSNGSLNFTALQNGTLQTVKVYTDLVGTRRIELRDSVGTILQFVDIMIQPDSQIINLNWNLQEGATYILGTNTTVNQAIVGWGNVSPRLKRNSSGVIYPMITPDAIRINGSNFGSGFYYYFYDWQFAKSGYTCESNIASLTVVVNTVGVNEINGSQFNLYPNPASSVLNIEKLTNGTTTYLICDITGRTVLSGQINELKNSIDIAQLKSGMYLIRLNNELTQANIPFTVK